jgi:hypothetical protein
MAKLAFDEILNEKENNKILLDPLFIDRETT